MTLMRHDGSARSRVVVCVWCNRTFTAMRDDAVTCSNTCRSARHRRRSAPLPAWDEDLRAAEIALAKALRD
jgi:hypothetical protein